MMNSLLVQTIIAYLLIFAVPMLLPVAFLKLVGLSGLRTLVTYEARDTPLHNLDPRLKVLYPVGMGILSILFTWKFMLIVFGLTIVPWFWLKPSRAKIKVLTVMIIGPAIAGFWGQGMYYLPPPPIHFLYKFPWTMAWLGSPGITTYGMIFGLQQTSRVLVTVSTSMLILISTDVGDFTWAFERFKAPPQVGFALTAALRFLPEMIARTSLVLRAVELRGYDMSRPTLAPIRQVAGLRETDLPVRGPCHRTAAHRHPAGHHDDGHGRRCPRVRRQQEARLASRAQDHRRRHLGIRDPGHPRGGRACPQPPWHWRPLLRMRLPCQPQAMSRHRTTRHRHCCGIPAARTSLPHHDLARLRHDQAKRPRGRQ
jgi:energy-coupling factor transporter transmembrane protein EcfT